MAGPALQLFPPPPRAPRQTSPSRRPTQIKAIPQQPTSQPSHLDNSKAPPADFHELVIQINSVPVSPANSMAPPTITAPPRAHIPASHVSRADHQTDSNISQPGDEASSHLMRQESFYRDTDQSSAHVQSIQQGPKGRIPQITIPESNRAISPAFSEAATLVRANSSATRVRSVSPQEEVPMRSMFPVYDPTLPLRNQAYKPTQSSPTQLPRTQISRSPYSPEFYVPHGNVRSSSTAAPPPLRPFFTPSNLLDSLWLSTNGQEEPAVQIYTLKMHRATAANPTITFGTTPSLPFYSLAQSNLASGHEIPSIMNELLIQRHHPTQPRVLPVAHLDLIAPPSMDTGAFDPHQQENVSLLTSIYPKLAALQALDAAASSPGASHLALTDPGAQSPAAQQLAQNVLANTAQRECCALAWTRDDPAEQANPWAQHMPSEGSYQLHHPTLGTFPIVLEGDCSVINTASTRPVTAMYGHNMPMTPQTPARKPASITLVNPFILSATSPRTNAFSPLPPPPPLGGNFNRPTSLTPSEMSISNLPTTTDATADDAILARLDFTNDALILNVGALTRFGNPFLVDVAASTLLAVAVAEASRGRKSRQNSLAHSFEPPPPSFMLTHQKEDTAKAFKDSFVEGFTGVGGKTRPPVRGSTLKRLASSFRSSTTDASSPSTTFDKDKDIELGDWYGSENKSKTTMKETKAEKKARKAKEEEDKLPIAARAIISVLTFAFKSAVFVLKIIIKVVAGVVVMITKNIGKL